MDECPDFEALASLSRLPAGDARRAHLEGCARCQARLLSLEEFLAPSSDDLPEDEWRAAEAELRRRRAHDGLVAPSRGVGSVRRSRTLTAWRPAFAAAAAIVIVAGAWLVVRGRHEPELRGVPGGDWVPTVETRGPIATIAWRALPGADNYRVVFLGASLEPVATLDVGPALEARVPRDSLPAGLSHGQPVMIEVNALHGPDPVAVSRAVPMKLP